MRGSDRRGVVLVLVLFFALLLSSTVATFARKALIDHMIVRNRDSRAAAEAIARGGVRLATALLLEDKYRESGQTPIDARDELWARVKGHPIAIEGGGTLELEIEDAASRLNLNAVMRFDENGQVDPAAEPLLLELLEKAIREIPLAPGEKRYDVGALAADLIDYVDADLVRQRGGPEDEPYQRREPPTLPSNLPLLSVDELRRVEGFDAYLVDALRPYVTVYPFAGGGGINPNTASPHVLGLLFFDDGVDLRLAPESTVRDILRVRAAGGVVCADPSREDCTPIEEIVTTNAIYPDPDYSSDVFVVISRGRVGEVLHSVEAVIDRTVGSEPLLLSWRTL